MPDGTSRFRCDGDPVFHYMGCSTFSNFTVLPEIAMKPAHAYDQLVRGEVEADEALWLG